MATGSMYLAPAPSGAWPPPPSRGRTQLPDFPASQAREPSASQPSGKPSRWQPGRLAHGPRLWQ